MNAIIRRFRCIKARDNDSIDGFRRVSQGDVHDNRFFICIAQDFPECLSDDAGAVRELILISPWFFHKEIYDPVFVWILACLE